MKSIQLLSGAFFASILLAASAFAGDPTGIWKFQVAGPRGKTIDASLALKLENNQLTGTVDNRTGKMAISDAKFADDQVTFTVTRELNRGSRHGTLTTHYNGKLEGDTIKGTIEASGSGGKSVSLPWEAKRAK